ncbi:MAG: DUF2332 domain-containing protein [Betaproteobacteria bacterium]
MNSAPDLSAAATLPAKFAHFAAHVFAGEPLYAALTAIVAGRPDYAALLAVAPGPQQLPMLWLAAVQDRVMELVDLGRRPALADYFSSVGGTRAPDDALAAHLERFVADERAELSARMATRTTQTNEIGRCAVLLPVLQALVEATGRRRIALLDVGCSAGLNLGVDRWRYRYLDDASGATLATTASDRDPRAPEIACRVLAGPRPASAATPEIVSRHGIDVAPISVDDAPAVRWLRACLWPADAARRARFDAAVAIARTQAWPVSATTDAAASIAAWRDTLPDDVMPVVFNSWVLAYFDADLLRRYVERLHDGVATRGIAWISAEDPTRSRTWWPAMPKVDALSLANATAWTVARPDGQGGVAWTLAATSHAHGHWMAWNGR